MFSYLMGNFFHNLKHILESQLYLGTGVDYRGQLFLVPATILTVHMLPIIFLSIADWKKNDFSFHMNSFFLGNWRMSRNKKMLQHSATSTAMILTYYLLIGWRDFSFLLALLCTQLISGGCQFQAKNNHHLAWFSSAVCYYPCKHVIYKSFFTLKKGRK